MGKSPSLRCKEKPNEGEWRNVYDKEYDAVNTYITAFKPRNDDKVYNQSIGLLSIDEVSFAGGVVDINNSSFYLYDGSAYWTMSPNYNENGSDEWSEYYIYIVDPNGKISSTKIGSQRLVMPNETWPYMKVRPVISLKYGLKFSGTGTYDDPFEIAE